MVVLNGGFGAQLTSDIVVDTMSTILNRKSTDAKAGAGGDAKKMGSHTHVLRGRHGKEYVNPGLVKMNDTTFLEHIYIMLGKSERLYLPRDLFIVGNDSVRVVMNDWCGENDVAFPTSNVVFNGLTEDTRDRQSDVADLALAIETFKLAESKCPLLVITADTIFFQDYNFSRVLEHSFVRNRDVVGTYDLTPGQIECNPNGAPVVTLIRDPKATMGKIKSVELGQMVNTGRALAPVMMLKNDTLGSVRGYVEEGGCVDMFQMFKTIVETKGEECYAIDLGFGRFDCVTLESLRYCEEFNNFYTAKKMVLNKLARTQDTDSSLDFKTSFSGRSDGTKEMNQVQGYGDMKPDLANAIKTFVKGYFEERTAALSGKMTTLTPANFYQTEYTINTPVVTPRPTPMGRTLG